MDQRGSGGPGGEPGGGGAGGALHLPWGSTIWWQQKGILDYFQQVMLGMLFHP